PFSRLLRRPLAICVVLVAAAVANGLVSPHGLHPLFVKGHKEHLENRLLDTWNSFSRVEVSRTEHGPPDLWGPSPDYDASQWAVDQRRMNIDGLAGTTAYGI